MKCVTDRLPEAGEYLLLDTGYTTAHEIVARRDGGWRRVRFPATCVLFRHPTRGYCLFDTGYAPRFFRATQHWPERGYALATPVVCTPDTTAAAQLARLGAAAADVRHVFLSHFHADHTAGLRDFPEATVWCSQRAWAQTQHLRGLAAVRRGVLRALEPDDLVARLHFFEAAPRVARTDVWQHHHDVFGDGFFRVIDLPGHARGQVGLLAGNESLLLAADACWRTAALRAGVLPLPTVRLFFDDWRAYRRTFFRLRHWWRQHPDAEVRCCHDLADHVR